MKLSKLRNRKKEIRAKENVKLKKCFCRLYPKLVENIINCNLGQNKMEQKTPLTLAAQPPPPPLPSTSSKSRAETARTPKHAIYILSLILDFFMGWGAGQRVDVNFPFILSEFVGQSVYWVTNSKSDLG